MNKTLWFEIWVGKRGISSRNDSGREAVNVQAIDEYIAACPEDIQPKLRELKQIIVNAGPELKEKISWQMPTFYLKGSVIHFAAHRNHIGLYPGPAAIEEFAERLQPYKTSKGAIRLPNATPLDKDLISDIVLFNLKNGRGS